MKFECPKCKKNNEFDVETTVCCSHCETSVEGVTFTQIKFITFGTALTFVTGGILFDKAGSIYGERLPIPIEFEIVQACLESDNRYISTSVYEKKKETCLCALDSVLDDFNYSDYKESPSKFITEYTRKARTCT
ncbi:MAG: hypothetical protein GY928_24065 [Colwellia sp.]|nr:hypothetical protein [Colwellia sp.]